MDRDTFRLLLIICGGLALIALYLWETRRPARRPRANASPVREPISRKREPRLDALDDAAPAARRIETPRILQLHVTPSSQEHFAGQSIVKAAETCGFVTDDERQVFRRNVEDAHGNHAVIHAANMLKPGAFPFGAMAEFQSPGLALFTVAEDVHDADSLLDVLTEMARCLAAELDGAVLDKTLQPLIEEVEPRREDGLATSAAGEL